jgi:hypothetical protein
MTIDVRLWAPLVVLGLAAGPAATAAEAKGRMTMNDKIYELKHAYAVERPGSFDASKKELEILLSVEPIPEGDLGDMMPGRGPRLSVTIDADGAVVGGNLFHESGNLSTNQGHELKLSARSEKAVAGRAFTKAAVTAAGTTFQYDVTFSADVWRKPVETAASPEDGKRAAASPQAQAYGAFLKAVKAGDLPALRKLVVPEMAAQMDDPEFAKMLPMVQQMTPKAVTYVRLSEAGDTSTLEVSAAAEGKGVATLQKVSGQWRVGRTKWTASN